MNFEEMRNQFAILKDQLNNQEIVSDHLLRNAMKKRNRDISSTKRMVYGCAVFCLFFYPLNCLTQACVRQDEKLLVIRRENHGENQNP